MKLKDPDTNDAQDVALPIVNDAQDEAFLTSIRIVFTFLMLSIAMNFVLIFSLLVIFMIGHSALKLFGVNSEFLVYCLFGVMIICSLFSGLLLVRVTTKQLKIPSHQLLSRLIIPFIICAGLSILVLGFNWSQLNGPHGGIDGIGNAFMVYLIAPYLCMMAGAFCTLIINFLNQRL